jgi:rod shape-determining protein MreC
MFIKRMLLILSISVLAIISIVIISVSGKHGYTSSAYGKNIVSFCISPIQKVVINTTIFFRNIWIDYFYLVSVAKENKKLKREIKNVAAQNERLYETNLANNRLSELLAFKSSFEYETISAAVTGKEPSPWFQTLIISKGSVNGVKKNMPVIVPGGVVGRVIEVFGTYSKVLLIIDSGSSIDALIQRTRARGIVKGSSYKDCYLEYVLRKHDIASGDVVISSGSGGVFPKGLRIGTVLEVEKSSSNIFQKVTLEPYVNFEKLEEVLIIIN